MSDSPLLGSCRREEPGGRVAWAPWAEAQGQQGQHGGGRAAAERRWPRRVVHGEPESTRGASIGVQEQRDLAPITCNYLQN